MQKNVNKIADDATGSSLLFGGILFYFWTLFYGVMVYRQFDFLEVVKASLAFLVILLFLAYSFNKDTWKGSYHFSYRRIVLGGLVFIYMLLFSDSSVRSIIHFPAYPLLQLDLLGEINRDSLFHVSLIQSILNFGYPSIAQHDTLPTFYHTLSHYVDAAIIKLSGVEAFDSYGMLFYFKTFSLVFAVAIFLRRTTSGFPFFVFFISLVILTPIIIDKTWLAISSTPLWFPTILMILSASTVFGVLRKDNLNIKDYSFLFFLICVISVGKVSSGFMYAVFLGFLLLLKDYKRGYVYVLGVSWCLFFLLFYGSWLGGEKHGSLQVPDFLKVIDFLRDQFSLSAFSGFVWVLVLFSLGLIFRKKIYWLFLVASLLSFFVFVVITHSVSSFGKSDVIYFSYGLRWVLVLFVLQLLFEGVRQLGRLEYKLPGKLYFVLNNAFVVVLFVLVFFIVHYDNIEKRIHGLNLAPFAFINHHISSERKLSLKKVVLNEEYKCVFCSDSDHELRNFRTDLYGFMAGKGLEKQNSLLFVTEEIFEDIIFHKYKKIDKDFKGSMIYAVTGVPLIHGLRGIRGGYGIPDYIRYGKAAFWTERRDFREEKACRFNKSIIVAENWSPAVFSLVSCNP